MKRDAPPAAEYAIALALVIAFVVLRLPLFSAEGVRLGWNSDAGIFGLMGRAMAEGRDFPLFFWGQSYLGTITSMMAAATGALLHQGQVGPLTLRISTAVQVLLAIVLYWLALRRVVGRASALMAAAWLIAGPSFIFFFVVAPIGAEQLFFAGAVLFWFSTRADLARASHWFVLGVICGAGLWIHQGVAFMMAGVCAAVLRERCASLRRVVAGLAGAGLGLMPVAIWWLGDHPILYRRTLIPWSASLVWHNLVQTVTSDAWLLLADESWLGVLAALAVFTLATMASRRIAPSRGHTVAAVTLSVSAAFWILSNYPSAGAVRYIGPAVPLLYGYAAAGVMQFMAHGGARRVIAVVVAMFIAVALYVPRYREARAVEAGRAEQYADWPGGFDPRPVLAQLRMNGYRVCYGEAWVAHKLEWISEPTVRFVPVRIVHRTLEQSLHLIGEAGPKCYVENDGRMRRLSAEEEAKWRNSVLVRARKAGVVH